MRVTVLLAIALTIAFAMAACRIVVRCSYAKFDPHPRVRLLHDMTNHEYIIETRRRHTGRLYVRKFGSREQAEKFFRNLTTGERL
jgi:ribosomal protein L33